MFGTTFEPSGGDGGNFQLIQRISLAVAAPSITFAAIPNTFKDLMLWTCLRSDRVNTFDAIYCRINGDVGVNYSYFLPAYWHPNMYVTTEGIGATFMWMTTTTALNSPANSFGRAAISIPDYANTTTNKDFLTYGGVRLTALTGNIRLYNSYNSWFPAVPAAIGQIQLYPGLGGLNWIAGGSASLYGLF